MRHVSRSHRVALDWLLDRINLDPQIQIKYIDNQKPTRRHTDGGKFHTWWMESFFCVCLTLAISVLPIVLKWCRKIQKDSGEERVTAKIEADDELGLATQRKDSWRVCLYWVRKPAENQKWKSITSELVDWAASKNRETCEGTLTHQVTQSGMLTRIGLLKSGNLMNWWK